MSFGQGGPRWASGTPDWAALAEMSEARARRRRMLMIGGGALATVAVGAAVAVAVVSANKDQGTGASAGRPPATADIPPSTTEPAPSFAETTPPPPPDPKEFISSAKKDKAPLTPESFFPGTKLTVGDVVYKKGALDSTKSCASHAQGPLRNVLGSNGCTQLLRATYSRNGVAVTVGVAVFDTAFKATKAKDQTDKGNVTSLSGSGVPAFCRTSVCRSTVNSYGRYTYYTIAGFTNGKDVTEKDRAVFTTGDDLAEFTFRQIIRRGEVQASAAANAPQ
ncbi:hypothetical protein ACWCP6_03955 [Streptomyces sp. NPDC002004]